MGKITRQKVLDELQEEIRLSDEEADKVVNFYLGGYFEG